MKYFSMFSGIGGFEHGIDDKGECVGFSEINKEAIKIYKKHFKHKEYGNAERIIWSEVGDFEWLVGGFPIGWTVGIPSTHRKRCLGNAVTTNVITAIFEKIFE